MLVTKARREIAARLWYKKQAKAYAEARARDQHTLILAVIYEYAGYGVTFSYQEAKRLVNIYGDVAH